MADLPPEDDMTADVGPAGKSRILHYRLINRIGGGGMGEVFLAQDEKLERLVALKTLSTKLATQTEFRERLKTEAKAAARLNHKNICSVYAIEECDDQLFIAMEYVQGRTLRELIKEQPLQFDQVDDLIKQCCDGLQVAHEEGIVHRDIKSTNIMLDKYGTVKILDFGLAQITTEESRTETSGIMGTYQYMSPEQISGKTVDHRSDIFSLGVVLHEVMTGALPFAGANIAAVAYAIVHDDPRPPSEVRQNIPRRLEIAAARALQKDPGRRYQAASEMHGDLGAGQHRPSLPVFHSEAQTQTVAVFPFRSLTAEADDAYLSEGICEDVITAIVKIPGLSVASQTAILRLQKRELEPADICLELNAAYYLSGSLRRHGDSIRLNVQLIKASEEIVVWSETFVRETAQLFSLQSAIAIRVATALNLQLSDNLDTSSKVPRVSAETYEAYLRAKFLLNKRDEASVVEAVKLLKRATDLEPQFPAAFGKLAIAINLCRIYGYQCESGLIDKAVDFAERAMELDPGSSDAHIAMYVLLRQVNIRRAISELRTATALDESNAEAYHWLAFALMFHGHLPSAERAMLTASRLDPFREMTDANLCRLYFYCDQEQKLKQQLQVMDRKYGESGGDLGIRCWLAWYEYDWSKAILLNERALQAKPNDRFRIEQLADSYVRASQVDRAIDLLQGALLRNPDDDMLRIRLGQAYRAAGQSARAEEQFDAGIRLFVESRSRAGEGDSAAFHAHMLWISSLRQDRETALDSLHAAIERGFGHYPDLRVRPDYDFLRGDRNFDATIANLEQKKKSEDHR